MLESMHCASNLAVTFWPVIWVNQEKKWESNRQRWGKAVGLIWSFKMSDMCSESGESTENAVRQPRLSLLKHVLSCKSDITHILRTYYTYSGSLFNFLTDMDKATEKSDNLKSKWYQQYI